MCCRLFANKSLGNACLALLGCQCWADVVCVCYVGPPEKARSTAAQLVSAIETR